MTVEPEVIVPRWSGLAVVAAPGPSLTAEVASAIRGQRAVAVTHAWRRVPWADVLYSCDRGWWQDNDGCPEFAGEKWSSHDNGENKKLDVAERYGLRLVRGRNAPGFSFDPAVIHYGRNSGFQAINLALLFGATRVVLVGFDMRPVDGRRYFCRAQPGSGMGQYEVFLPHFAAAAKMLPEGIEIVNATPHSALRAFPMADLSVVL